MKVFIKKCAIILVIVLAVILIFKSFICGDENQCKVKSENRFEVKDKKPVIYLYPTIKQKVEVTLDYKGKVTCTYPEYKDSWRVEASPDGTLRNLVNNKEYSYLFWEGIPEKTEWDLSKGFVVKGKDTACFLQEKLSYLGLKPNEYNDFIVYWLGQMQCNKYNLITFLGQEHEDIARLNINPKPDSIQRVFMVFKSLDKPIEIKEQKLETFTRKGFSVIEWGGMELK